MAFLQEVLTEITCIFSGMAEMDETDIAPPRRSAECLLLSSSLPRHALKGRGMPFPEHKDARKLKRVLGIGGRGRRRRKNAMTCSNNSN